ncbi:hypothetical protein V2O64_21890 [Verrucomicrobiaceae bacterium 227]
MAKPSARFLLPLATASLGITLGFLTQKQVAPQISNATAVPQPSESSPSRAPGRTSPASPTGIFLKKSLSLSALESFSISQPTF